MKKYQSILLAACAVGLVACEPEFDNEVSNTSYSKGEADFSSYVALGNSLTAGFMDGTMYRSGQQYSFPNLLAKQFAVVGGGAFTQPSFGDDTNDLGGLLFMGQKIANTRLILNMSAGGPESLTGTPTIEVSELQAKAYNNMGVPLAKSFHLLAPGYGNLANMASGTANPYFVRHATSPNTTILSDAMSLNPTFFTNWIGSNDVLSYATSGGVGVNQEGNLNPATYGSNDITDPQVFASAYSTIINTLTSNGAKGVVATIPYVTSIPHFTTVPYNPLTAEALGGQTVVNQLNTQLFGPVKQILTAAGQGDRIQLYSSTGQNPLLIADETLTDMSAIITGALIANNVPAQQATVIGQVFGKARHATRNDLFVLGTSGVIGEASALPAPFDKLGVTFPLEDKYVLIPSEQENIKEATDKFNDIIWSTARSKKLAVADMNAIMRYLTTGIRLGDGQFYTANYFNGQNVNKVLFSLDGIHPNPRGYAFVANEIVKVINEHYKAQLPLIVPGNYPGVTIKASN
ncbi:SGNH/GDSL hydrolase family protein [Paenimyroides aestuarii]|uniref:G-D-S-L family lipolytic protein n=1 Tax=Paenimyroides aestuarii TaxID=2968490 RepID=A0ABY5NPD1_9FLAO|nr:SGNH/GDSL hydrolase family protein [Paenimyroides aestuarii]UUV20359.1 G-D-S-L family lipolytic protein [Paenimyroides aestuarii]